MSAEEDAGDFQLFSETPKEAAKRDQAIEKAEADKLERAKEEARRNAPDLPLESDQSPGSSNQKSADAESKTETTPEGNTRLYSLQKIPKSIEEYRQMP